jgi:glycosyltransferase involved in cell wall biosynthesis
MKMCEAFADLDNQVVLYGRADDKKVDIFDYYNVKKNFVFKFFYRKTFFLLEYFKLLLLIKRFKPDVIYGRHSKKILFLSFFFKIPIVLEVHRMPKNRSYYFFQKVLFKLSNFRKLVTITNHLKDEYIQHYPCLDKKVFVAHDAANEIFCDYSNFQTESLDNNFKVGYIGSLNKLKGINFILKLAEELADIEFHIVGGNEKQITALRNEISGLKNIFFHGHQSQKNIKKYAFLMDVLIAPYPSEQFAVQNNFSFNWMSPLKLFEYMSYKKPIIATNLNSIKEVVENDRDVLLCEPDNLEEWKSKILLLKNNSGLRERLANSACNLFLKEFTWKSRAKKIIKNWN